MVKKSMDGKGDFVKEVPEHGYTKKVIRNKLHPKGIGKGTKPLAVIEYRLSDEARDKLQVALQPYVKGEKQYNENEEISVEELATIIKTSLPPEALRNLRRLANPEHSSPATVCIIRNLPEIPKNEISLSYSKGRNNQNYSYFIIKGVSNLFHLTNPYEDLWVARRKKDTKVNGDLPHSHVHPVGTLSGFFTDGAITRFIDSTSMAENILSDNEIGITPSDWRYKQSNLELHVTDKNKFGNACKPFSQDVVIGKGDIVFYPNDGRVLHQALLNKESIISRVLNVFVSKDEVVRLVIGRDFERGL